MIVHYLSQTFILLDYSVPSELDHWSPWPHWKWFKVRCADPCPDSGAVSGISTTVPSDVGVLPAAVLGRDSGHWETPLCPPGSLHWTHLQGKHTLNLSALWFLSCFGVFIFYRLIWIQFCESTIRHCNIVQMDLTFKHCYVEQLDLTHKFFIWCWPSYGTMNLFYPCPLSYVTWSLSFRVSVSRPSLRMRWREKEPQILRILRVEDLVKVKGSRTLVTRLKMRTR